MIRITNINGQAHYIAPTAIASVTEAGASSQWHGIKCVVKLFDGERIEAQETARDIAEKLSVRGASDE